MHSFLRAIGFSEIKNRRLLEPVYKRVLAAPTKRSIYNVSADTQIIQLDKDFGDGFGISLVGESAPDGSVSIEHYFPYLKSDVITYQDYISIEKHGDKEAYAGVSDDLNLGMALIFFLQNISEYAQALWMNKPILYADHAYLAALSAGGKVILDLAPEKTISETHVVESSRRKLINAVKRGEDAAMESLTLKDMDMYAILRRRIKKEDVLSIVSSSFMPYGIETEHYSVIANILSCDLRENTLSGEKVYVMDIETNDIMMKLAINQKDLLGEPAVGRRFKGEIWLQGRITI